ncbi:precorrin-6A reductase [Pilimelia anulata]|uniref:Precorrin-6A reductase n=1 Tax=Pilimelia anulata TaxID=53371 RepID=A0A8J3BAL4_9ACTN|nr:cobalt-precorrin-6A reductase [Pilimelia anulata]GGJ90763.1 precorrin-6A reductase [Pilimelia anulata]
MTRHLLILGGTTEGRRIAEALAAGGLAGVVGGVAAGGGAGRVGIRASDGQPAVAAGSGGGSAGWRVTTSLAGRVSAPRPAPGTNRSGGFGGVEGLAAWLRGEDVAAVIDATHPFAARITANAAAACAATGVPLLVVQRPGWREGPGDRWERVPTLAAAAERVPALAAAPATERGAGGAPRVLLATGRQSLPAFVGCAGVHFVARMVDPPDGPLPPRCEVVLSRGPFSLDSERALLDRYAIDLVVTKDSGGDATVAKLHAARERALPVIMVNRPPLPPGVTTTPTAPGALTWLTTH